MPQIGFYCPFHARFNKKGKLNRRVDLTEATSTKLLKKSADYVPLRCESNGKFTLFDEKEERSKDVDPHKVKCNKGKLRPTLKKHKDQEKLCSEIGADGRLDDLQNTIRFVEIGWNMSAMTLSSDSQFAPTELKDVVN